MANIGLDNLAVHRNKLPLEATKYLVVQNKAVLDIAKNIAKQDWILHDHAGIMILFSFSTRSPMWLKF